MPFCQDPSRAARALAGLWEYAQLRARPDRAPTPVEDVDRTQARLILAEAWETAGEGFLDAEVAAQVAAAYGIQVPFSSVAATVEEAVTLAERAGYPVVAKLIAPGVVHKADVGGIALDLRNADAVRATFARMVGDDELRAVLIQQMALDQAPD